MRTKTPKELRDQMARLADVYAQTYDPRVMRAYKAFRRYINNMRRHIDGGKPLKTFDGIGQYKPVPVAVYTSHH